MLDDNEYEFEVGDKAYVVSDAQEKCLYGWSHNMDQYVETVVTIRNKRLHHTEHYIYNIEEDKGVYSWCSRSLSPHIPQDFTPATETELEDFLLAIVNQ